MQNYKRLILVLILILLICAAILGILSVLMIISGSWINYAALGLAALSVLVETFAWLIPISPNAPAQTSTPSQSRGPGVVASAILSVVLVGLITFTIGIGIQPLLSYLSSRYPSYEQVISKPSRDFSLGSQDENGWDTTGNCAFMDGSYHVKVQKKEDTSLCFAEVNTFSNFAFQVQMTVLRGEGGGGGIIFRSNGHNTNSKMYRFRVGEDASYDLYAQDPDNNIYTRLGSCPYPTESNLNSPLLPTNSGDLSSSVINAGLNKTNTLTVIAKGRNIGLYVNSQLLLFVCNDFSSSGLIGLYASSYIQPSEVQFQNARLWTSI